MCYRAFFPIWPITWCYERSGSRDSCPVLYSGPRRLCYGGFCCWRTCCGGFVVGALFTISLGSSTSLWVATSTPNLAPVTTRIARAQQRMPNRCTAGADGWPELDTRIVLASYLKTELLLYTARSISGSSVNNLSRFQSRQRETFMESCSASLSMILVLLRNVRTSHASDPTFLRMRKCNLCTLVAWNQKWPVSRLPPLSHLIRRHQS